MLNLIDEHTRECLMIRPERRWSSAKVIEALADGWFCVDLAILYQFRTEVESTRELDTSTYAPFHIRRGSLTVGVQRRLSLASGRIDCLG